MSAGREDHSGDGGGGRFHTVQPLRDLESNWSVDLAKNLEDYLLKICSGEISREDDARLSVNFAEAALLLQGSIQVYSRKVEYLYSLVLHALEFVSQKRQPDQSDSTPIQLNESGSHKFSNEDSDSFWVPDDVPVEAKINLDSTASKNAPLKHFVKPPANLVVLEGDCLDTTGDGGELESYLLATHDLYQDFILLDSCDAASVQEFLKADKVSKRHNGAYQNSSLNSKFSKCFLSPSRRSGGSAHKSPLGENQDVNLNRTPAANHRLEVTADDVEPNPPAFDFFENNNDGFDMDDGYFEPSGSDLDDDEDPWKPLNPYEPGNLKVKPFKKVNSSKRHVIGSVKRISIATEFPLAKLHGPISYELKEIWEKQCYARERREPDSPSLYEKLRQSLVDGGREACGSFCNFEVDNEDNGSDDGISDFGQPDADIPEHMHMNEEVPLHNDKYDGDDAHFDTNDAFGREDPNSHASLEDLCRSHLDALLASIAETEKQTELAARVSTWKQKIEHNLEEQELHPPFDIHDYGNRILDKLALEANDRNAMSFIDIVRGQDKHDVARTFSALLQLVNNGSVDLDRGETDGNSVCYTSENPFYVQRLSHDKAQEKLHLCSSKKRAKSPTRKGCIKGDKLERERAPVMSATSRFTTMMPTQSTCKFSVKVGGVKCTPEGKRRRRSRLVEPIDLHPAG